MNDLESFAKQQVNDIKAQIKDKETKFRLKNKSHFDEIDALSSQIKPLEKLLKDYEAVRNGKPIKQTRQTRKPKE